MESKQPYSCTCKCQNIVIKYYLHQHHPTDHFHSTPWRVGANDTTRTISPYPPPAQDAFVPRQRTAFSMPAKCKFLVAASRIGSSTRTNVPLQSVGQDRANGGTTGVNGESSNQCGRANTV